MPTAIRKVDLSDVAGNLETVIKEVCAQMEGHDYKLAATFVFGLDLVLIFQNIPLEAQE